MNERIRELQIQADAYADEIFDRKGKMYGEIVMEKFAELIVQECISVMKSTVDESIDFDRKPPETSSWIESDIKQHFGVEE